MRLPITPQISTKDGVSAKNARLTNCLKESKKGGDKAVVRPGLVLDAQASGVGHGLVVFNNELVSVYGTTLGINEQVFSIGSWASETVPARSWTGLGASNTKFCAVGGGYSAVSTDGVAWSESSSIGAGAWCSPAWNGAVFCTVQDSSDEAAVSTDGLTWTVHSLIDVHNWCSVAWNGTLFCAVCYDDNVCATSPDGQTWTIEALPVAFSAWTIAAGGATFCVVGGGESTVSTDGASWSAASSIAGLSGGVQVAWNGTKFCATASGADNANSADGINWVAGDAFDDSVLHYMAGSNGLFVAVTASGYLTANISTDNGATWTTTALAAAGGEDYVGVAGMGNQFFAIAELAGIGSLGVADQTNSIAPLSSIATGLYDFAQSPL